LRPIYPPFKRRKNSIRSESTNKTNTKTNAKEDL